MANDTPLYIRNTLAVIITISVNLLAVLLPLNNKTTKELSDQYPNLFVPSGFTFSIWSVIFILLIYNVYYQWRHYNNKLSKTNAVANGWGNWYLVVGILNGLWLFAWHYEYLLLSIIIMISLLISLIKLYKIILNERPYTINDKIGLAVPISVYLGWISVAIIANVCAVWVGLDWPIILLTELQWAKVMISVAGLLALFFIYRYVDVGYGLVIIWALYGIYSKHIDSTDEISKSLAQFTQYIFCFIAIYSMLILIGKKSYLPKTN